jgi:mannose-1-phosphate guanylyltransferase
MLYHQIEALAKAGVKEVVLAVAFQADRLKEAASHIEEHYGVKIIISEEKIPLGTAGPLALAREILQESEEFIMLNADVMCEFPLKKMLEFHRSHGCEGTIAVTKVLDPSKYGVIVFEESGKVASFVEKPPTFVGDRINAGIYIFNKTVLDRVEAKPMSIERIVFPRMASDEQLYAFDMKGFWMDVGQPMDFLSGINLFLKAMQQRSASTSDLTAISPTHGIIGNVLIDPTAIVEEGAVLGPDVTIGPYCVIKNGCRISRSAIMEGAVVGEHSLIFDSLIGWKSHVGRWCRIVNFSVFGADVTVADELFVNGGIVCPNKKITADVPEKQVLLY